MDRRAFLATGATVALLPLTEAPALAAVTRPGASDARLNHLFEHIFQERVRNSPELATSLGLDKGPNAALKSKLDTRPVAGRAHEEPRAQPPRYRASCGRSVPRCLSEPAKLNREVVIYSLETATQSASRWDIDSRAAALSDLPAGRRLFRNARLPQHRRTRSTMRPTPRPICRGSQQFATMLDNDTAEQRAQAARGFLAPGWSIDLALGQMRKLRDVAPDNEHDGRIRSSSAPRAKNIGGDWQSAPSNIVAEQRLSRARPPDRGDGAIEADDAVPATARGACRTAMRSTPRRCAEATTTNFSPARSPPDGPAAGRRDQRRDRHDPQEPGLYAGQRRRTARRAQQATRASSTRTPTPAAPSCSPASMPASRTCTRACRATSRRCPTAAARNPPRSARNPGRRVERLLPPRVARWLASGDLLHQPQGHRRLAEIYAADAHLSRGRPGPSPADQHRAGIEGHPDAAQARLLLGLFRRLGALRRAARRRARRLCRAIRSAAPASSSRSCSAPRGWWSTPASTPSAGAASRRPTTWSRRPASPARARSARSSVTAPRSARRAATRSATPPGSAPATKRRQTLGDRSSTSSNSTKS